MLRAISFKQTPTNVVMMPERRGDSTGGRGRVKKSLAVRSLCWLRRVRAFIWRDVSLTVSYRMDFLMRLLQVGLIVTLLFFMSRVFAAGTGTTLEQWRDPFAAWITGLAFMSYFGCGFSSLSNAIRGEQMQGTLENVLLTPISVPTIIIASSAWEFVQATFFALLYLFLGWFLFGVQFKGNILLALSFLGLTAIVLHCIGIISASFTMVFKRGDPFGLMLGTGAMIFSGILFPTQLLGGTLASLSCILPTTYGVDGIRQVLLEGQGWAQVRGTFWSLSLFLVGLLPFSLMIFGAALRRAKREGSLIQY